MANFSKSNTCRKFSKVTAFKYDGYPEPTFRSRKEKNVVEEKAFEELIKDFKTCCNEMSLLEKENILLKSECDELKTTQAELVKANEESKRVLESETKKSKLELAAVQYNLIESENKQSAKIEKLTAENKVLIEKEVSFLDQIDALKSELRAEKDKYSKLKEENDEYFLKSNKYKSKLKCAVNMIKELNTALLQCNVKCVVSEIAVQTADDNWFEDENNNTPKYSSDPSITRANSKNKEDIMLSEIFFKLNAKDDPELFSFNNTITESDSISEFI